jgi:NADPH2:quinone reductase
MRAVIIRGYGGPDVLELADVPTPQPRTGQVRIRVHAAPVHPVDIATRAGRLAEHGLMAASGDVGMGWDLAGVIDALGPGVDRFKAGDTVIAMRDLLTAPIGAQAEQVVLDTSAVAPAPRSVAPVEASTIPLNSLTADQALDLLALRPGQWLLVTGAAGAVGGFALELAALRGLRTVAVAAPRDEELVRELVPRSSSPVPRTWARRSAGSYPPGCTARSTPGSPAWQPWMPSGTKAHSWRSRPVPRPSRCAARACTTSGSTPTGRGWPSSPRSSTPAS